MTEMKKNKVSESNQIVRLVTMITDYSKFKPENIIFEKVKAGQSADGKAKYHRIVIKYRYDDGTVDQLSIKTPLVNSWGIQENNSTSFTFPLVLCNDGSHADFIELIENIVKRIREHLNDGEEDEEVISLMKKYNLEQYVNNELDIFYWKKDEGGMLIPDVSPTIYAKLLTEYRSNEITTGFFDPEDNAINPKVLFNQRCEAVGELIIDNIFINTKPSIQTKLNDVVVTSILSSQNKVRKLFLE